MTRTLGYLVPEFPRQTHIFFWRECEELRRLGVEPVFLSTRRPANTACPHPFRDQAATATHYVFPPRKRAVLTLLRHPLGTLKALGQWLRLRAPIKRRLKYLGLVLCAADMVAHCRRRGVKHIHVHSCADAALLALFAHHLAGLTYSLTLHNPLANHGPHQRAKWGHAAFSIVVANVFKAEVERELAGALPPVYVAPMGVDLQQFTRPTPYTAWRGGQDSGPFRIFACGRLNPCKGHDLLMEAVQQLAATGLPVELALAGEDQDSGTGQFRHELEAKIAALHIADRVTLLGSQTEAAIRAHLSQSHVFVLASRTGEAMPVVLIEAMAMGVPVIATNVGGTTELVQSGTTGQVVPPHDVPALVAALLALAEQPATAERFSTAGRQMVETGYTSARSATTIVQGMRR